MNLDRIFIDKRFVYFEDASQDNLALAMSCQSELMKYGFMLDRNGFEQLQKADAARIAEFYKNTCAWLKDISGSSRTYTPLYSDFPRGVLSLSESERRYMQMIHYLTHATFDLNLEPVPSELEHVEYKIIKGGSEEDLIELFKRLAETGTAITPTDLSILKYIASNVPNLPPVNVKFKENLASLINAIPTLKVGTVTDVLRIATVWSGGDVALTPLRNQQKYGFSRRPIGVDSPKFNLTEKQIVRILDLFESSNLNLDEMNTSGRYGRFIRLGEVIHPGKYKNEYPKTFDAFNRLRNQKTLGKLRSWHYNVEQAFKRSFKDGLDIISQRPGEFLRKIDWIIRKYCQNNPANIHLLELALLKVAEGSSNKVLYEVYTHLEKRRSMESTRSVFIKGSRKPTVLPVLPPLSNDLVDSLQDMILDVLKTKFKTLAPLGKVWIDPELRKIPLPTNMRTLSESMTPTIRGTRVPIGIDSEVIRMFVHWYNDGSRRCDIDLSGILVGDKKVEHIGWNGSHVRPYATYSGDVTGRSGPCAEYIDIDIKKAINDGFKYVMLDARDYCGIGFHTYKECVCGFQGRSKLGSENRDWKPETIKNSMKITTTSKGVYIAIIDLETMEYIWLDIDSSKNTASSDIKGIARMIKTYSEHPKLSLYDLFEWHAIARGSIVTPVEADIQFTFDEYRLDYSKVLPYMGV